MQTNCWTGHGAKDLEAPGEFYRFTADEMVYVRTRVGAAAQETAYIEGCKEGCRRTNGCEGFILVPDSPPRCYRKGAKEMGSEYRLRVSACLVCDATPAYA